EEHRVRRHVHQVLPEAEQGCDQRGGRQKCRGHERNALDRADGAHGLQISGEAGDVEMVSHCHSFSISAASFLRPLCMFPLPSAPAWPDRAEASVTVTPWIFTSRITSACFGGS